MSQEPVLNRRLSIAIAAASASLTLAVLVTAASLLGWMGRPSGGGGEIAPAATVEPAPSAAAAAAPASSGPAVVEPAAPAPEALEPAPLDPAPASADEVEAGWGDDDEDDRVVARGRHHREHDDHDDHDREGDDD